MSVRNPLIFRGKCGETVKCQNAQQAATLLRNNPGYYDSYPGMDSFSTLREQGVDATGGRIDGTSFLGNVTSQPGYAPGQKDSGGDSAIDLILSAFKF